MGKRRMGGKVRCIPPPAPPASLRQELKSGDVPKRHAAQKVRGKFFCDKFGEKIRDMEGDKNKGWVEVEGRRGKGLGVKKGSEE